MAISRQDPDLIHIGAADGGVLKSTNAGTTWNRVLFVNDSTGAIDIDVNP
jgi:photosystem II stability/assembly factor-like uncharacterized protein